MDFFKAKTMQWWEIVLVKIAVFCLGVAAGAYWANIFSPYVLVLAIVGLVLGLFMFFSWFKK